MLRPEDISAISRAAVQARVAESQRSQDETLSFVSHDLRNLLNVILMAAEFLRERTAADDDVTRHWLQVILQVSERMNTLITDVLIDARTNADTRAQRREPVSAALLIREAATAHDAAAERKQLRLELHIDDDTLQVNADSTAVVRALSNLIENAVKHTQPHGLVSVTAEARNDDVQFCVADNGSGIPAEFLPHIFDRFWQAPGTHDGGSGLGLAIVKSVVEAHGGRVWVESTVGVGSAFYFTLAAVHHAPSAAAVA